MRVLPFKREKKKLETKKKFSFLLIPQFFFFFSPTFHPTFLLTLHSYLVMTSRQKNKTKKHLLYNHSRTQIKSGANGISIRHEPPVFFLYYLFIEEEKDQDRSSCHLYITSVTCSLSLLGLVIIDRTTIEQLLDNTETSVQSSVPFYNRERRNKNDRRAHFYL